jgi:hypothetical protein
LRSARRGNAVGDAAGKDRTHGRPQGVVVESWPQESRETAQLVIDQYGEPHEATDSLLTWHRVGPWKRLVASREFYSHEFPAPHIDSVESFVDYRVPPEKFTPLAEFDA